MAKILQLAQLGHPVLREKSIPIKDIKDKRVQALIEEMVATLIDTGGVGLAAPQVYESIRLFVITPRPTPLFPETKVMEPTAIINPTIVFHSEEKISMWESCLSIPGIRGLAPRSRVITVEYLNRAGVREKSEFRDLSSIIFQHELDHLDGLVYLDRLESIKDIITEKEYQRLNNKTKPS